MVDGGGGGMKGESLARCRRVLVCVQNIGSRSTLTSCNACVLAHALAHARARAPLRLHQTHLPRRTLPDGFHVHPERRFLLPKQLLHTDTLPLMMACSRATPSLYTTSHSVGPSVRNSPNPLCSVACWKNEGGLARIETPRLKNSCINDVLLKSRRFSGDSYKIFIKLA